ncbi:class I SAM-dependent methyltransferase [Micromonospora zhanjiangensis]|uniref:Class I SAM-dependent methyltransferase n=1 Tax=Micromonospora zhanjiangensis TaxID=1522057 RepID=A0ABV8KY39_9ACTN
MTYRSVASRSAEVDKGLGVAYAHAARVTPGHPRLTKLVLELLVGRRIALVRDAGDGLDQSAPERCAITGEGLVLAEGGGLRGLAEAWCLGEFVVRDLDAILSRLASLMVALSRIPFYGYLRHPWHLLRASWRRGGSAEDTTKSLAKHYDLEAAFFRTFLDESLTYSCAIFRHSNDSLAAAQRNKYRSLTAALPDLRGASVLEIGCGWGGLAQFLAGQGALVTAVSASASQIAYCRSNRPESIRFVLGEYRSALSGKFDAAISCEMIEGVGGENAPEFMRRVSNCLNVGGTFALQAITTAHHRMLTSRPENSYIDKYIFPGGQILSERYILRCARRAGFSLYSRNSIGSSYATTLERWRSSFRDAREQLLDYGCSERFLRCWDLYFSMCMAGFSRGDMDCLQLVFRRVR